MHACTHTYTHIYVHTHTHTCMHACMHAFMHAYIHTYTHTHIHTYMNNQRSLDVKLPTIWTDEKQSRAEAERRERLEERRSEKRKSQKKEDANARKGRKAAKHCVFPMICGSGGSKSKLAKAAGAEPAGQMRDEKLHAVVARSTSRSQNAQNTSVSDHFWTLGCWKSARRCGAKHISKSKCTKHLGLGPLLDVEMSKKCTPLWREAHFEVKMHKALQHRTTFGRWDVEKDAVLARSRFRSENVQNITGAGTLLELAMSKKHMSKWKCAKHHMFAPLLEVQMSFGVAGARDCAPCQKWAKREGFVAFSTTTTTTPHYTPIHYTTLQLQLHLHYIPLHWTPVHYTALNYTQLHYTTLHYTTLHYTTLHYTTVHYLPLHFTTLHYTTLRHTTTTTTQLHSTAPLH